MGQQRERSGTPLESRGAATQSGLLAEQFLQDLLSAGRGRQGSAAQSLLGGTAQDLLADPASRTQGLFKSLEPFERRQTEQQVAGFRELAGTTGGRFSRNLFQGEGQLRGEIADQFLRTRQEGLMAANQQRMQALMAIISPLLQGNQAGPPVFEPSAGQQLLSAGTDLGGAALTALLLGGTGGAAAPFVLPAMAGARQFSAPQFFQGNDFARRRN
jgi:hypothetical protein